MGRRPAATGDSAPAGGWSSGMHPPLSSSQSPLSPVSVYGENCARSLAPQGHFRTHSVGLGAPPLPTARGAAGAPHRDIKKKMRRARWKRKNRLGALRCGGPPCARGSAYRCLLRFRLAFGHAIIFCKLDTTVPWRMVPTSSGWLSHRAASLFAAAGCSSRERERQRGGRLRVSLYFPGLEVSPRAGRFRP